MHTIMVVGVQIMDEADPHSAHEVRQVEVTLWLTSKGIRVRRVWVAVAKPLGIIRDECEFLKMVGAAVLSDC